MSVILEEGIGFGGTDKDYPSPNSPTDVIISQYESIMNRNIAAKSLKSATSGEPPTFTKEEMAYLTKKALDESSFSEVKVLTPDPTITLKKGNTEINVKNAAAVVRKMEEKYPNKMTKEQSDVAYENHRKDVEQALEHNPPPKTNTVNKNAYEIRLDVLKEAMTFLNWTTECSRVDGKYSNIPTSDDALALAQKFYRFVENKR